MMRQLKIRQTFTVRTDTVDDYLRDINALDMVGPDEEAELALRVQQGDDAAFKRLVEANLRFVVSVAKQYIGTGLELSDLINEGNIGLMIAVRRFDPSKGFKLISFAVWWIRQSIMSAVSGQGRMVRLPQNQVGDLNKIRKASAKFMQTESREPSEAELAELTGLTPEKICESLSRMSQHESLDKQLGDEDSGTLIDILPDKEAEAADEGVNRESLKADLMAALSTLSQRESEIIRQSFGIGCHERSLDEIGESMELTRERVRQIREKAVRKLSRPAIKAVLRQYL